jgi:hypothetical protein
MEFRDRLTFGTSLNRREFQRQQFPQKTLCLPGFMV